MSETKNMSVQLPIELHQKVTEHKDEIGCTLSEYVKNLITQYYEIMENGGKTMAEQNTRTLAIQVSAELMDRLDAYLNKVGIKKKAFITEILEKALAEAETQLENNETEETGAERG